MTDEFLWEMLFPKAKVREPADDIFSAFFPTVDPNRGKVEYENSNPVRDPMTNISMQQMQDPYKAAQDNEAKKWKTKARTDRFPKDGGRPVKASVPGYEKIPWFKATVSLIGLNPGGYVAYAKTAAEKKDFAFSSFKTILVCWPGVYSQDIFVVDDMNAFRKALGFKKLSENLLIDEDGEEWVGR